MNNYIYYISTFLTLLAVSYYGYRSSKKVKTSSDFSVGGRRLSSIQVSGSIIATIVGGASTIGTAQLAYSRGVNAMWFTLGASIACIFLGLFLAKPLRSAEVDTVGEYLVKYYGKRVGVVASILTSVAIFIHITGQTLSSVAILTSMFNFQEMLAVIVTMGLIISYIIFGGFWGTSVVGILKTLLLYFTLIISGFIVLGEFNGFNGIVNSFPKEPWFNLFSQGKWQGLAQGFSMVIGISATQSYLQALFAGKDSKTSKKGAFLSALLIPPIGLVCTFIGMFMSISHPNIEAGQALPAFILTYLNPWIGGLMIAALIISVVGTGAGLTLGISTMISRDIYLKLINPKADNKRQLQILRISVFCITGLAMIVVFLNMDSLILKWGFLSMALRGNVIFLPLVFAVIFKEKVNQRAGLMSMIISPIMTITWTLFKIGSIDPLYVGLIAGLMVYLVFYLIDIYNMKLSKDQIS